ncbi:hypothetical protein M409DRAFT_69744 [Zasmidium cellare ATCC 36951]|uniref:Uncharacterized protein n=1 Tax=Zasmidium cellare ATCC 36951 TaxID=1080233 RepID=A0A6A6C2U6_ZASCE|nr:uncharacterized protein M409DRAFT_69744 [Zasmidium cellare ATCC 36951]KAF2161371.1 hypothetical protein M409DRAFT_69744 [Zasmidium cellare ATCC 36951]
MDDIDDPLTRLQMLQRDLSAFNETRLENLDRLELELAACRSDLQRLLHRNRKSEQSRAKVAPSTTPPPTTLTIDNVDYEVNELFRQSALYAADVLDLDELEAALLCIRSQSLIQNTQDPTALAIKAVVLFHEERVAVLECVRIIMQGSVDGETDEQVQDEFRGIVRQSLVGQGGQADGSAYWNKCMEGLSDIEAFITKVATEKDKAIMTGEDLSGIKGEWLVVQRMLLTRQHESMASIVSYLMRGGWVQAEQYRGFLSRAASVDIPADIAIHYLPSLISGSATFACDHATTTPEAAASIYNLFAAGSGQLQWRNNDLQAAATVFWLAEYNAGFTAGNGAYNQGSASQTREDNARAKLFFDALKGNALRYILATASFLKPVVWHDPARTAIVYHLAHDGLVIPVEAPRPSPDFSNMTMRELQVFGEAMVANMSDALRKLKVEEDENRRALLSQSTNAVDHELDLERFMVILAYAWHDDAEAANELWWANRESNLFGFLRFVSQRLSTPRVAALCTLLQSIACDEKTANAAHRFLLEDAAMIGGKVRKTYAISWSQIFSELELYASTLKDRPSAPKTSPGQDLELDEMVLEEGETSVMLESYLGLTARICRNSPDARNWLLKEQTFHLGEVMFQLLRSADYARIRACCLELLTAFLTDNSIEVRNGLWVLFDSWVSSGGLDGSSAARPPGRRQYQAKHYLSSYAADSEAGAAMVAFINALASPMAGTAEQLLDQLPFPEALGRPHRHEGIHSYVDFVMDDVLARKITPMQPDEPLLHILRYECLHFAFQCLSTFNEDIVLVANTTNAEIDSAMETKSFVRYASLHPFARVMEWLFDKKVASSLFMSLQQSQDALNDADPNSPLVQSTLKAAQVLLLAWDLQPTYFDLVRPTIVSHNPKTQPISATWTSIDEIFLTHLSTVMDIAQLTTCGQVDIGLECIKLLEKIGASRKLSETAGGQYGSRIISVLTPVSDSLTTQLTAEFTLLEWDLESNDEPLKVVRARAVLNLLKASLKMSDRTPGLAHTLLGFRCRERVVEVPPESPFDRSESLFHAIAACAGSSPTITPQYGNTSWLLALKRGCLEVILKLAVHPLTARIVQPILRSMDLLGAVSHNLAPASASPSWDGKVLSDVDLLRSTSAYSLRDFMRVRESFFEIASTELRTAATQSAYSVQEKIVSILLGTIKLPTGEEVSTASIFELFDFFDAETTSPFDLPPSKFFGDDVSACTKEDPETGISFDLKMANLFLVLRKKQLKDKGIIQDATQETAADDEIVSTCNAMMSQNSFTAIQSARLAALEAWTDLVSMIVTTGGMQQADVIALSLQGLLVTLPKFERSLSDNMDAAALLAKLTLNFTQAIIPASQGSSDQTASVAIERMLSAFRVSLKVITDSTTDLGLRDVAYRTCCAVLASIPNVPTTGRNSQAASARQLLQLVQNAGERLLAVTTEDTFSGRGATCVSALLFLDGLVLLFQGLKANTQMLRGLMKLNFVPVLIDTGIGNVASAFKSDDETIATMAFYHTAMALLLRLCNTVDGAQLVINSGLFPAIEESKLFSTDPDIGLDIENPAALEEFYAFLGDVVRLMTATVVQKGAGLAKSFLQQHHFTVQAILKQATRGQALDAAEELCRLLMASGFLEDDQSSSGATFTNGFT